MREKKADPISVAPLLPGGRRSRQLVCMGSVWRCLVCRTAAVCELVFPMSRALCILAVISGLLCTLISVQIEALSRVLYVTERFVNTVMVRTRKSEFIRLFRSIHLIRPPCTMPYRSFCTVRNFCEHQLYRVVVLHFHNISFQLLPPS